MNHHHMSVDDLPDQQGGPEIQGESTGSRWEVYRKALISFLVLIVVGAVVGAAVSLLIH
ncbi:MAG: hypothetical protein P8Y37_04660 [Anaerolineales bacterium]